MRVVDHNEFRNVDVDEVAMVDFSRVDEADDGHNSNEMDESEEEVESDRGPEGDGTSDDEDVLDDMITPMNDNVGIGEC